MTKQKIEKLIAKFSKAARNHFEASLKGDWKTANEEAHTIKLVTNTLSNIGEAAKEALLAQTESSDLAVSSMAAVYSLNYAPERSVFVLTEIAKEPGLIGFEAKQALQRWKEGDWHLTD